MIRSRGLTHAHPGATAIRFPDVDLAQGQTLLLHGPSGAGKSTWLALASALLRTAPDHLWVNGQDLGQLRGGAADRWRAHHVGFLPQRLHLSEALDVRENLELVYFAAGLPPDRPAIRRALQALGVDALAGRRSHELSVGQAQRVALARALLLRPPVLLVDEPTASLDDVMAREVMKSLSDAVGQVGATLVIATHDARVMAALPEALVMELAP